MVTLQELVPPPAAATDILISINQAINGPQCQVQSVGVTSISGFCHEASPFVFQVLEAFLQLTFDRLVVL